MPVKVTWINRDYRWFLVRIGRGSMAVGEICSREVVFARRGESLRVAAQLMREKGVRRVPVVDARGALVGIISADDFIDLLAEELSGLARTITNEQRRELRARAV
jgi:CBS domain-containing protein